MKSKTIKKKIIAGVLAVTLAATAVVTGSIKNSTETKAGVVIDNGETPILWENKVPILERIMAEDAKLVILEIVPQKYAGVFDMLTGSKEVRARLEADKAKIFNAFNWNGNVVVDGLVETVTVAGVCSYKHPYKISHNILTDEYTVDYEDMFLDEFLDGYSNPAAYTYFSNPNNFEVRTVVASELKESDLEDVSLIYIADKVENYEVSYFNYYIQNGVDDINFLKDKKDVYIDVYKDAAGTTAYKLDESNSIYYDAFYKNSNGEFVNSDMEWDMVEKVLKYIYEGNDYTDGTPIPVFANFEIKDKELNVYKLLNLVLKTSDEADAVCTFGGKTYSSYYENVLKNIVSYKEEVIEVPTTEAPTTEAPTTEEPTTEEITTVETSEVETSEGETLEETEPSGEDESETIEVTEEETTEEVTEETTEEVTTEAPTEAPTEEPVVNRTYFYNKFGAVTGAYIYGNDYITNWTDNRVYLFDLQCTAAANNYGAYIFNYAYINNNNESNSVFAIGMGAGLISDAGSASVRNLGSNNKFSITNILQYLLGVQDNRVGTISVLEIEPCQDYSYSIIAGNSLTNVQVYRNIAKLGEALKIKDYADLLVHETDTWGDYQSQAKKDEYLKRQYQALVNAGKDVIKINSMTVSEFNSLNEDLMSTYDIIYIGENSGMFNSAIKEYEVQKDRRGNVTGYRDTGNGLFFYGNDGTTRLYSTYKNSSIKNTRNIPIYNDTTLDGYVYTAFGDLCKGSQCHVGYLPTDYVDITNNLSGVRNVSSRTDFTSTNNGTWYFYSTPHTTGLAPNWQTTHTINPTVNRNSTLWTPLIYNALKVDGQNRVYVSKQLTVTNANDYTSQGGLGNIRYSANDLTNRKRKDLEEYISFGNPVILSSNVYNCTTTKDIYTKKGGVVYPTSQVYNFVSNEMATGRLLDETEIKSKLLTTMNGTKLTINSCTTSYTKGAATVACPEITYTNGAISNGSFIESPDSLVFNINFDAVVGRVYKVVLIFDKNTNGIYNDVPTTDDNNEVMYSGQIKATAKSQNFTFSVPVPKKYNGLYSWRVQVSATKNNVAIDRDVYDGATPIKGETKEVRVLQIIPNRDVTLNMANQAFSNLMTTAARLINYNVVIDTITADNFENIYANSTYTKGTSYHQPEDFIYSGNANYGGDYNMIVVGFSDSYNNHGLDDISNDHGALDNIRDFVDKGGAFLMSHDTVSFSTNVNYSQYASGGSTLTQGIGSKYGDKMLLDYTRNFRSLVGMDVYGVTTIPDLSSTSLTDEENMTYVPKKIDGTYITEIQGFTDFWAEFRSKGYFDKRYASSKDGTYYYISGSTDIYSSKVRESNTTLFKTKNILNYSGNVSGPMLTTKVDEINKGQVTTYPYKTTDASGQLTVAGTHGQYNLLHLEDEDVVVWYTLSGTPGSNNYYGDNLGDGANNYYIYSKNNITYTGAGHSSVTGNDELKLFVNTVIKAADAGNYIPEVVILNGAKLGDSNEYMIYANATDKEIKVNFVANDSDLADRETASNMYSSEEEILAHIGRFANGNVYWITPQGEKKVLLHYEYSGNKLLNGEQTSFYICDPSINNLNDGMVYTDEQLNNMKLCYANFQTTKRVELFFEATDSKGAVGSSKATIVNQELFDID